MDKNANILYRTLQLPDFSPTLLGSFHRYQETTRVWYEKDGQYLQKEDHFIDEWDDHKKEQVISSLRACVASGGVVVGAYVEDACIGFVNVEGARFGSKQQYVEMPYIHVSNDWRGAGLGRKLFAHCCEQARQLGATKLYIAAHPSVETQHFYRSIGCTYAKEINEEILAKEPLDIQMEFLLSENHS
ncbi:hypothetical protein BRE01_05310 [Brevibacillus reuszeri]|uniref:N-acetyltransferase domain-containing protein n=1 Tax=Brevibacillus reuszeri TaxID=54915 RepID=A0ABQ0TG11_9BACL|nr:GNAT family N-acetyltransferase [Brevibacillus reuszeri]MED1857344.1 GNAT family N-acetyltransferase [Brevibacillus reuszeri]GED66829.1 hypothetical protein BRE01_05310 [Brevibacillus reuszeri]